MFHPALHAVCTAGAASTSACVGAPASSPVSSAIMPPSDPPVTNTGCGRPSARTRARMPRAMSRIVGGYSRSSVAMVVAAKPCAYNVVQCSRACAGPTSFHQSCKMSGVPVSDGQTITRPVLRPCGCVSAYSNAASLTVRPCSNVNEPMPCCGSAGRSDAPEACMCVCRSVSMCVCVSICVCGMNDRATCVARAGRADATVSCAACAAVSAAGRARTEISCRWTARSARWHGSARSFRGTGRWTTA